MQCFNIVFVIQQHLLIGEVLISNDFFLPLEISIVHLKCKYKIFGSKHQIVTSKRKKLNYIYL